MCLLLCVIYEHQKTVFLALSLVAAPQKESNIKFTYRHLNSSRSLLPASRQCVFFGRVGSYISFNRVDKDTSVATVYCFERVISILKICMGRGSCLSWNVRLIIQIYSGTGKSLAEPGRNQFWKHARDVHDFNNIETRAITTIFSFKARRRRNFTSFWQKQ